MINLEWLRTFRAVYKSKSLSKASELLSISQPTVSQQLAMLEAHMEQKLFLRKSKGVEETDEGRILNTLIAGSMETLETIDYQISKKKTKLKEIITIGISEHLYSAVLSNRLIELGENVHVKFGTRQTLIPDVEEGRLMYAIVPDKTEIFDAICYPLFEQKMILVGTNDIDLDKIAELYKKNDIEAEKILTNQTWFAHDRNSSYIKYFWVIAFNKKRPAIVPNYVVPNEYEVLKQLASSSGVAIALQKVVESFLKEGSLKSVELKSVPFRNLSLYANKKRTTIEENEEVLKVFKA